MCNKKGCTINNYPLRIQATNIITKPHELDIDTLERMVKKEKVQKAKKKEVLK